MSPRKHHLLSINGVRIHAVEEGSGPLVVMVHGFPESWYSWRHQLTALAAAGYRAVAIDQRGYGQSSKFWQTDAYRIHALVGDVVGVVHALGEKTAVVIGHDWGAPVAWTAAWLHPEVFTGVIGLSVPFSGRGLIALPGSPFGERHPGELHAELAGPGQTFYQDYFGAMDAVVNEIESDVRGWLRGAVWSLSGAPLKALLPDFAKMDQVALIRGSAISIADGGRMSDRFMQPDAMPAWFTEADLDVFTNEFERSGFGGPLAFYHNLVNDWHDLEAQADQPLTVPALFIGGEFDVATGWGQEAIARASERMPNYVGSKIFEGSGHWIQQEQPAETNAAILEFLAALK
ncbi:alpha/beta hydrolase [Nevskia sp.]|uniref:alpha/beta fold hydrolase n=1 Tax=Nevskia sp. TaxID=1929292 RepID=UPI0025E99CC3|nr:alpha/beta hydrolase [Nevskia sp.]